jgi:hypothetical protein
VLLGESNSSVRYTHLVVIDAVAHSERRGPAA